MSGKIEYTTVAHRITASFPRLSYVGIQINFWIIANCMLMGILFLYTRFLSEALGETIAVNLNSGFLLAVIFGVFYGLFSGFADYQLEKSLLRKGSLGKSILIKAVLGLGLIIIFLILIRLLWMNDILFGFGILEVYRLSLRSWDYLFGLILIYYFFMTLLINFINLVNKKYGPGVLLPLLFGRYQNPREEDRIFMFMDLKSSTSTAELLGHLQYSAFIRDAFADINEVIYAFRAQIYQYVGDEIVLMWPEKEGIVNENCIRIFFACRMKFEQRNSYYLERYGLLPQFKAGAHYGKVTAVEIGEVKKDIAYHGDTLNTAARIQSICNEYQKDFLVSGVLLGQMQNDLRISADSLGMINLRGKKDKIEVFSIENPYRESVL